MPKILNKITSGYPLTESDLYSGLRLIDLASASFQLIMLSLYIQSICNFVRDLIKIMLRFHQQYQCEKPFLFTYLKGAYRKAEWCSGSVLGP